jgi:hypothetical protein
MLNIILSLFLKDIPRDLERQITKNSNSSFPYKIHFFYHKSDIIHKKKSNNLIIQTPILHNHLKSIKHNFSIKNHLYLTTSYKDIIKLSYYLKTLFKLIVSRTSVVPLGINFVSKKFTNQNYYLIVATDIYLYLKHLENMSKVFNSKARSQVASDPKTPKEILKNLSLDIDYLVRKNVAENPNTPIDILLSLSEDLNWSVRNSVSLNPNTTRDLLAVLAEDGDWYVSHNALMKLKKYHNP